MNRREFLKASCASLLAVPQLANVSRASTELAERAAVVGFALTKVQRWLYERALPRIDPETGLYRADGRWNYRDTAADCYPFFCWAAYVTDTRILEGPALRILEAEQELCNYLDRIPAPFDWKRHQRVQQISWDQLVFEASEYVKDGLIAIVEAVGEGPWMERLQGIEDDIWKHAPVDTPRGRIPSTNVEVNGEQLQVLPRLFSRTGDEKYLDWSLRLAHYYLDDPTYVPKRLRDHGCEIIGGLGLLLGVLSEAQHAEFEWLAERLQRMFDRILESGCNEDGLMYNNLGDPNSGLSDNWGYNYIAFADYDLATGQRRYEPAIRRTLKNLNQPKYYDYAWGGGIDGFADSIEGAIYLLNRYPDDQAMAWVDRELQRNVLFYGVPQQENHLWGTAKLESNGVRTVIMYTLMLTQGVLARPWDQHLRLAGRRLSEDEVLIYLHAGRQWKGRLQFDRKRHRLWWNFRTDWPRLNTLPEWFTVDEKAAYLVQLPGAADARRFTGRQLHEGIELSLAPGEHKLIVRRARS